MYSHTHIYVFPNIESILVRNLSVWEICLCWWICSSYIYSL